MTRKDTLYRLQQLGIICTVPTVVPARRDAQYLHGCGGADTIWPPLVVSLAAW